MDALMLTIWNAIVEGMRVYATWESTHFLKTKYVAAFILFGWPFLWSGLKLLRLAPSLVMPHVIELGDISDEVKKRATKEYDAAVSKIEEDLI